MTQKNKWYHRVLVIGVLCLLEAPGRSYSVDHVSSASKPSASAPFDFDPFTKHRPFRLNTLPTTVVDGTPTPAWADIVLRPENFLACKGAPIALCYYSGPAGVTPCEFVPGEPYVFFRDPDGYEVEIWYELPTLVDPPAPASRRGTRRSRSSTRRQ